MFVDYYYLILLSIENNIKILKGQDIVQQKTTINVEKLIIEGQRSNEINIDGPTIADELNNKLKNINISKTEVSTFCWLL